MVAKRQCHREVGKNRGRERERERERREKQIAKRDGGRRRIKKVKIVKTVV